MADETTNWDYHPDEGKQAGSSSTKSVSWEASEYIDHKQGPLWFLGLIVVTAALAVGVYFWLKDYFATGAIVAVGIIAGVFARHTPRRLKYTLSVEGLSIGDKNYPLSQFKSFSVIEEGPISSIELTPLKRYMPPVSAFFETADQNKILDVLEDYLPFEEKSADRVERLSRRLRF